MRMLRGEDVRDTLVDETALPGADPDLLAGPFAHIVVDEAQELTDAEWQMLLLRCPSRSFTIVGDRAQARHGFTESWQERLERVGLDRINLASLSINYRTPEEVMAEAEPVIRAALPDANVPTSIRSSGIPVVHGSVAELDSVLDTWLAAHADGIACVIGDPAFRATLPRPVADPGAVEGARVRPGRPHRPGGVRRGHRRSGRPLCRDDPGDPAARHPHELRVRRGTAAAAALITGARDRAGPGSEQRLLPRDRRLLRVEQLLRGRHHRRDPTRPRAGDQLQHRPPAGRVMAGEAAADNGDLSGADGARAAG